MLVKRQPMLPLIPLMQLGFQLAALRFTQLRLEARLEKQITPQTQVTMVGIMMEIQLMIQIRRILVIPSRVLKW